MERAYKAGLAYDDFGFEVAAIFGPRVGVAAGLFVELPHVVLLCTLGWVTLRLVVGMKPWTYDQPENGDGA